MASRSVGQNVTSRIKEITQPKGGYLKPLAFEVIKLDDGKTLNPKENIHGTLIGLVVDYMTRVMTGTDSMKAFHISLKGAKSAVKAGRKHSLSKAIHFLSGIHKLEDKSIINACKLVTFDTWTRNSQIAPMAKTYDEINPDEQTIENIRIMINRSINFFEKYGPVTEEGFTFEPENGTLEEYINMISTGKGSVGGYTSVVCTGDGDFLTKDTMWDFKVTKNKITKDHTLQLLMYWIMGQHSGRDCFKNIDKLGFFNPRNNTVYLCNVEDIPQEIIEIVEKEVICYE